MARTLVLLGLGLVVAGVLWPLLSRIGLGRLPGDIVIRRPGFSFYLPLGTCLLISVALSAVAWLIGRFR